jgi:hypothetical protein
MVLRIEVKRGWKNHNHIISFAILIGEYNIHISVRLDLH